MRFEISDLLKFVLVASVFAAMFVIGQTMKSNELRSETAVSTIQNYYVDDLVNLGVPQGKLVAVFQDNENQITGLSDGFVTVECSLKNHDRNLEKIAIFRNRMNK